MKLLTAKFYPVCCTPRLSFQTSTKNGIKIVITVYHRMLLLEMRRYTLEI
jgi:hypothetical protein